MEPYLRSFKYIQQSVKTCLKHIFRLRKPKHTSELFLVRSGPKAKPLHHRLLIAPIGPYPPKLTPSLCITNRCPKPSRHSSLGLLNVPSLKTVFWVSLQLYYLYFHLNIRQTFQKYFHEQDEKQNMPEQLSLSLRTVSFRVRT